MRPQQQYENYRKNQYIYLETLYVQKLCNSLESANDFLLKQGMCHNDPRMRFAAAFIVGKKDKPLFTELLDLLDDEDLFVQQMARMSLIKLTKKDFGPLPGASQCQVNDSIIEWKKELK